MKIPNLLWMVWWLFGGIVLLGLVLRQWSGDHLVLSRYIGYVMPWLLLGLLPGLFWAGWQHYRGLFFLLVLSSLLILITYAPLFFPRPQIDASDGLTFKVLSYNIWSKNQQIDEAARVITEQQPDILLLQEMTPDVFEKMKPELSDLYDGQEAYVFYEPHYLLGIVSRYPAENRQKISGKGRVQKIELRTPKGPVTVYNVHLLRRGGWRSRYNKITSLLENELINETGPVILGGDFNIPDQSQTYKRILEDLDNAHWEGGFGFGFSFPTTSIRLFGVIPVPSLIRIDHIFFNDRLLALSAATIKDPGGSDHFPVSAVLGLK